MEPIEWTGALPTNCEICNNPIGEIFVDGKLNIGGWAFMCILCHEFHGEGLGHGHGQKYQKQGGSYVKVEG